MQHDRRMAKPNTKMIQIRHVPASVHRKLKQRAAAADKSLSDYLREEIERMAGLPTLEETLARIRRRRPIEFPPGQTPAEVIRRLRDAK
jgi:plasmid stability protein